ncbi:hypothetical protein WME94_45840 [Sorangium sp. So ce429]
MGTSLVCAECKETVNKANIMTNDDYSIVGIMWLKVVCKLCTSRLDSAGDGQRMHHLWELEWVLRSPIFMMADVISSLWKEGQKWSEQGLNDLFKIMSDAHPNLSKSPFQF